MNTQLRRILCVKRFCFLFAEQIKHSTFHIYILNQQQGFIHFPVNPNKFSRIAYMNFKLYSISNIERQIRGSFWSLFVSFFIK